MNRSALRSTNMMRRLFVIAPSLIVALAVYSGAAEAAMGVTGKPKVAFFATATPGALDIEGDSSTVNVTDDGTKLAFAVPMESVHTGIDMRDDHMNNEFVEISKFPNATLTVARADLKFPTTLGETAGGTIKGTFNVHGVDVVEDVTYTLQRSKTGYRARASFKFDASQHGITIPSYLGITVDPKMNAEVTVDLIDG